MASINVNVPAFASDTSAKVTLFDICVFAELCRFERLPLVPGQASPLCSPAHAAYELSEQSEIVKHVLQHVRFMDPDEDGVAAVWCSIVRLHDLDVITFTKPDLVSAPYRRCPEIHPVRYTHAKDGREVVFRPSELLASSPPMLPPVEQWLKRKIEDGFDFGATPTPYADLADAWIKEDMPGVVDGNELMFAYFRLYGLRCIYKDDVFYTSSMDRLDMFQRDDDTDTAFVALFDDAAAYLVNNANRLSS